MLLEKGGKVNTEGHLLWMLKQESYLGRERKIMASTLSHGTKDIVSVGKDSKINKRRHRGQVTFYPTLR